MQYRQFPLAYALSHNQRSPQITSDFYLFLNELEYALQVVSSTALMLKSQIIEQSDKSQLKLSSNEHIVLRLRCRSFEITSECRQLRQLRVKQKLGLQSNERT
jgi:hypothetical protein